MARGGDRGWEPGRSLGDLSPREPAGLGSGGDARGVSRGWGGSGGLPGVSERSGAGEACGRPGGCKGAKSRGFSAGCSGLCHGVRAAAGSCPRVMLPVRPRQGAPSRVSVCQRPAGAGGAGSPLPPGFPRPGRQPGSVADGAGAGVRQGAVRASGRAAKSRRPRIHELPLCLSGARLPGAGREFSQLLSCIFESEKLELLPLLNQTPELSRGDGGMAAGNRMGQQGERNCFSCQPFPLHQEKMNQLLEMGIGVRVGGGRSGEEATARERTESPKQPPLPPLPFPPCLWPLLFLFSQEENQVSLGQNLSSQESRKTHRLKINNHRTPQCHREISPICSAPQFLAGPGRGHEPNLGSFCL